MFLIKIQRVKITTDPLNCPLIYVHSLVVVEEFKSFLNVPKCCI